MQSGTQSLPGRRRQCLICRLPVFFDPPVCASGACRFKLHADIQAGHRCSVCLEGIKYSFCPDRECRRTLAEEAEKRTRVAEQEAAVRQFAVEARIDLIEVRMRLEGRWPAVDYVNRAVLPANERAVIRPSPERRLRLEEKLRALTREVAANPDGPTGDAPEPPGLSPARSMALLGCAACRGHCCMAGEDSAYLTAATLRRTLKANPKTSAEDVIAEYLSHVQTEAYQDSCIYHTAAGCSLPRAMRSDTCNRHFCRAMQRFIAAAEQAPAVQPTLAAAEKDGELYRLALLEESGLTLLHASPPRPPGG
ncbi:MAG: hypothetical protein HYY17_16630 [Planctomycetes bacterium]|nr:hypothetical protein [Planctomycetota bacterium]